MSARRLPRNPRSVNPPLLTCSSPPNDSLAESNFFVRGLLLLRRPLLSRVSVSFGLCPCPTATNHSCLGLRLTLSRIGDTLLRRRSLVDASLTTISPVCATRARALLLFAARASCRSLAALLLLLLLVCLAFALAEELVPPLCPLALYSAISSSCNPNGRLTVPTVLANQRSSGYRPAQPPKGQRADSNDTGSWQYFRSSCFRGTRFSEALLVTVVRRRSQRVLAWGAWSQTLDVTQENTPR